MILVGPEAPLVEGIADYFSNDPDLNHIQNENREVTLSQKELDRQVAYVGKHERESNRNYL